jgi:regulator of protease activity HflC (stomatin/prohibitin superfamily)
MERIYGTAITLIIFFILLAPLLYLAIKIVREYQRLVVFRLGRCIGHKGPGLVLLIPFVDRLVWVDLRELFLEIPKQTCITKDNAPIDIDFLIYWKVVDPVASVIQVGNFAGASQGIATTTLRAVIGDILLDDVLAKREQINQVLRVKLDEVTERWGVKVTSVEIREILPPRDVQTAMNRQLAAERDRRAMVTEARVKGRRPSSALKAIVRRLSCGLRASLWPWKRYMAWPIPLTTRR